MSELITLLRTLCWITVFVCAIYAVVLIGYGNLYGKDVDYASERLNASCFITPTLDKLCVTNENFTCRLGMAGYGEYWLEGCNK